MLVSVRIRHSESMSPRRSARSFICSSDSSPETYSTDWWIFMAICNSNVDFPIPGWPPISTSEPATIPPPSTRFNSSSCVSVRLVFPLSISCNFTGFAPCVSCFHSFFLSEAVPLSIISSTKEFQAPQSKQRPCHLGEELPHSLHTNTFLTFATLLLFCRF